MGGKGSGNWCRWNTKTTTDDVKKIDIRLMKRKGWFIPGHKGSLKWTSNGEPSGNINYTCHNNSLTLNYRFRNHGEEWQPVTQIIQLDSSACNYGGNRQWFLCPNCGCRCAILYGADVLFLCRKCYNLPYDSQMLGGISRVIERKHKLGFRIFDDYHGYFGRKKKGLHWKTFEQLREKYIEMEMTVDWEIYTRFGL